MFWESDYSVLVLGTAGVVRCTRDAGRSGRSRGRFCQGRRDVGEWRTGPSMRRMVEWTRSIQSCIAAEQDQDELPR